VKRLAEICIYRPVFATMLIMSLIVVGIASFFRLSVDRFPSVDLPTVTIRTTLPGASPEEMETEVSQKVEEVVNTIEGLDELRSVSGQGSSFVIATFSLERDIDAAAQDVREKVATITRDLPEDADPPIVSKFDNDSTPILSLALYGEQGIRDLTEIADKVVKVQIERAKGVGEVQIVGGLERTVNVWVDAEKLASYRIPITQVREAVVRQNAEVPGGTVTGQWRELTLRTMGKIREASEFNEIVIGVANGSPIKIKNIGYAEDGTREERSLARLNGKSAVTLEVRRQSGANTIEVISSVKENLARIRDQLPGGLELEIIRDQSDYIYAALHEINLHLILGSLLASLVVLAFMKNWRATIVASIAIPASVISTFALMWALGFTMNSVTMLALVLMVGIVIDDAIVVLENIFRVAEEKNLPPFEAAKEGTGEIALAVLATTLSLVVIFLPVSFMSSISGRFLYQFGITAACSIMVSLLVSFTLTPSLSARLIKGHSGHNESSKRGFYGVIERWYERLLTFSMRHRFAVALLALLVILSSVPLYKLVKQDYLPSDVDEGEFQVSVTAPEGTSFPAMNEALISIEAEVSKIPGVRTVLSTVGGGFLGQVNSANMTVKIAPHAERYFSFKRLAQGLIRLDPFSAFRGNYTQRDVMQQIRQRLKQFVPLRIAVRNFPAFNIGGGNFDIDFIIRGPELKELARYTDELRKQALEIGGIVDPDTTLKLNNPELQVTLDRARGADLGVTSRDIGTALRLMVGGDKEVSTYRDPQTNEDYDVQLRLIEENRSSIKEIPRLLIPGTGGVVELRNIASIEQATTAARIDRLNRQRAANVRAGVAPGFALADRLAALKKAADELKMPSAYTTTVAGKGRELEKTFYEFGWAFLLSIVFMYMILAAQYESFVHPLTILVSLPLSVPFALLSLWGTGSSLNLYSALGILVLFGVVKKNSILQVDHMNQLREKGLRRMEAILQGNRDRLRPILMTTLALVAGMLPLALGSGPGAEERRAVAIVVIGGQTLSLLLTLLVTPVVYSLFDDLRGGEKGEKEEDKSVGREPVSHLRQMA